MFCRKCGHELKDGIKFCPKCGTQVLSAAPLPDDAPVQKFTPAQNQKIVPDEPVTEILGDNDPQITEHDRPSRRRRYDETEEKPQREEKNSLMIFLIILLAVMILAVSFAAFWFLGGKPIITGFLDNVFGTHFSAESESEEEETEEIEEDEEDQDFEKEEEESLPADTQQASYDTGERDETAEALRNRGKEKSSSGSTKQKEPEKEDPVINEDLSEDPDDAQEDPSHGASTSAASVYEPDVEEEGADYIFPESDVRYLSKAELTGMTAWELRVARNEIYARHGRKFTDEELQRYFDDKDWYHGNIEPGDFKESMLNEIEKQNCILITDYEKEMGYR